MEKCSRLQCTCKLAELMRSVVPRSGTDYEKILVVEMKPGTRIGKHAHREHTVIYYPQGGDAVTVVPTKGMILYLPPNTEHSVLTVKSDRVSVAMLVNTSDS